MTKRLTTVTLSFCLMVLGLVGLATPAQASAPILVSGQSWLGGNGVNVCTNNNGGGNDPLCGEQTQVGNVHGAYWQCVELAQRLYKTRGWHPGIFSGVAGASQIYDSVNLNGFTRQANSSIVTLVPGDMIIHGTDTPGTGGAGHVSIVDSVVGTTVNVVEQNTYNDQPRAAYSFINGKLTRANMGTIRGIVHDPDNSNTISNGGLPDGTFLAVNGVGVVHRMVGGAPIRLTNWGVIPGCCSNVVWISQAQFDSLRSYPSDGAIVNIHESGGNGIYRFVGGAPLRLYNWGIVPGCCSGAITVNHGSVFELDHMRAIPADGAIVTVVESGGNGIYRFVGGAPIRLYDWGAIPGCCSNAVPVNAQTLQTLDHMNPVPANHSSVNVVESNGNGVFKFAGGAPLRLYNWGPLPDCCNAVDVNSLSVSSYDHMNQMPSDGTYLAAYETGEVYRVAGGAPLKLYDQGSLPGCCGDVNWVNAQTITTLDHMRATPADGTVLLGLPSNTYWVVNDGKRSVAPSGSSAIAVNDLTIQDIPTS